MGPLAGSGLSRSETPNAISIIGMAICPTMDTPDATISGSCRCSRLTASPARMPAVIGFRNGIVM